MLLGNFTGQIRIDAQVNRLLEKILRPSRTPGDAAHRLISVIPVSYTHLDVYKRQVYILLGNFTGQIRIDAVDNRLLEKILRPPRTPGDAAHRLIAVIPAGNHLRRPAQYLGDGLRQFR